MEKIRVIKSIKILLGDPSLLSSEQLDECYEIAVGDFELFSSVSQKSEEELQKIRKIWIKKYAIAVAKEIMGRASMLIQENILFGENLLRESEYEKNFLFRICVNKSLEGFVLLNKNNV
jgi:hypothetical protein